MSALSPSGGSTTTTVAPVCGAWNGPHDCLRPAGHTGDHWCGGWDSWQHPDGRGTLAPGPLLGCGDVWERTPEWDDCDHSDPSCDCDYFNKCRDRDHPPNTRCCASAERSGDERDGVVHGFCR